MSPSISKKSYKITSSKSSGKGGQNVNKTNTKATLLFSISNCLELSESQKQKILQYVHNNYPSFLIAEDHIQITCQETRSLIDNSERALKKLQSIINRALIPKKIRRKSTLPKREREARLRDKQSTSLKKTLRKRSNIL